MPPATIRDLEELKSRLGDELAVSDWLTVTQERIQRFADATDDHQWIHLDAERAARTPFGGTIAHGFLTLSLLPHLLGQTVAFGGAGMTINCGVNKVRFTAPVRSGSRIRARVSLVSMEDVPGGVQVTWGVVVELEGSRKPACVAELVVRRLTRAEEPA